MVGVNGPYLDPTGQACFHWAVENQLLKSTPILKIKLPPEASRGLEYTSPDAGAETSSHSSVQGAAKSLSRRSGTLGPDRAKSPRPKPKHFDPDLNALVFEANP